MPSPRLDRWRCGAAALLLALACTGPGAQPAPTASGAAAAPGAASAPTRDEVDTLAQALRQEPGLLGSRQVRKLHFRESDEAPRKPEPDRDSAVWRWIRDFVAWFNEFGRWLVWTVIAVAVALLLLRLWRLVEAAGGTGTPRSLNLPTQVRGLDIRPDSLPDDIGGTAWRLWQAGEQLAALSLLYRGALSQLVHGHAVPIRASSTEGECLRLAQPRLAQPALGYLRLLVRAWGEAVYAQRWPAAGEVQSLCQDFARLRPAAGVAA
jgi:hypothetical protein